MDKNKRIIKYDIARTFAILCVLLCHCTETIYNLSPNGWDGLSNQSRIFMISSFTIGRLGVPIFLFLSGALLLKKQIETDEDVFKFYKNNLLPLVIANSIWVIIYNIFFCFTNQEANVTFENIIKELLIMKNVPVPNMWYFPMIIGMYIGIPFIAKLVNTFSVKSFSLLMITTFISSFTLPVINIILAIFGIENSWNTLLDLNFLGGTYGLYILLGYCISHKNKIKINNIWISIIAILNFGITVGIQLLSYSNISKYTYNVWYNNPFLLICTACLFILFNRIDDSKVKMGKIFTLISRISLSLFFIHYIVQTILKPYILNIKIMMPLKVGVLFLLVSIISIMITYIISRIKCIAKYALLIK